MIALEEDKIIIKKQIDKSVKEGCFTNKDVLIFGCTIYTRDIREALRENKISLNAILDNNRKKAGMTCLGVPVYLPDVYFQTARRDAVVIICSKYHREMTAQLHTLGCGDIINISVEESRGKEEDSLESLQDHFASVEEGYRIYLQIQRNYSERHWLLLCPYPGTGDIYMACIYLDAYLEREGIQDYVLIVTTESCRKTAALFGIPDIWKVSKDEMQMMLKAWEFFGTGKMKVKPLLYWGWRTKRYLYADEYPQITFNEMFLYDVFNLPSDMGKKRPAVNRESRYAEELFRNLCLKPHGTLIMAPYAGSFMSEMGMEVWEQVAAALAQNGWTVATNCCGEKEPPVPGTVPVWFPYEEAVNVLEYAGGFMALRSGLCDIVSQAECRMIILYESGFNAVRYEYFSLRKMGLNPDAIEFVYEKNKEEALKQAMVEAVGCYELDVCG